MDLQTYLNDRNITKYRLSQMSGVPKTTIIDICSGKSSLQKCSARTVWMLAKALDCTMESIMEMSDAAAYDEDTGLPMNKSYLECGLPSDLRASIKRMATSWAILDRGEDDCHWDIAWDELNVDINAAEREQKITSEQAKYLREKYLRIEREEQT